MMQYSTDERLTFDEYHEFLRRTDLGSQYPEEDFDNRIRVLLEKCSLTISVRSEEGKLIGVCLGLTDFAYFLFISDLGVDRNHVGKGLGKKLMELAVEEAGGKDDITVVTVSNEEAYGFYQKIGMRSSDCLYWKCCEKWTPQTIE